MPANLGRALHDAFQRICDEFTREGILVVMPTYTPQRGRLLDDFARAGGRAVISGGKKGFRAFGHVPQFGIDIDTTTYNTLFPPEMTREIVGAIPDDLLRGAKVALFSYMPPPVPWEDYIKARNLGTEIVATSDQNTRAFFEKKSNLAGILQAAGLGAHVIPTEMRRGDETPDALKACYHRLKSDDGRVVVQGCGEAYEETLFIDNEDDFIASFAQAPEAPRKVARFITGVSANLSLFIGNTQPAAQGRGVAKVNVPAGIDLMNPDSIHAIEENAARHGLHDGNTFSVTGRATLKVVGDPRLANAKGDGVGNNIGHVYDAGTGAQIAEIGAGLGKKMALCGKVGLAGMDLIIDRQGHVWINEINDRQQGPTDQMSMDAESLGLPGLSRMAWFSYYGDFTRDENLNVLAALRDNADAIHAGYASSRASFYLKASATHSVEYDGQVTACKDLAAGVYRVNREKDGWMWSYAGEKADLAPVDLQSGAIMLRIEGGSLTKGEQIDSGAQLFRISGMADGANAPFCIENGVSKLAAPWVPVVEALYVDCFGPDYLDKNPLRRALAAAPAKPAAPKR